MAEVKKHYGNYLLDLGATSKVRVIEIEIKQKKIAKIKEMLEQEEQSLEALEQHFEQLLLYRYSPMEIKLAKIQASGEPWPVCRAPQEQGSPLGSIMAEG